MIALRRLTGAPYQCITESVDVQQVANLEKKVPLDWIAPDGMHVTAAFSGETGRMIALKRLTGAPYQCVTESVDVNQVANFEKKVPLAWITPDGMQVTPAFEEYARPLILDELTPIYVNGTPRHVHL